MTERLINRCNWVGSDNPLMLEYHGREWGVPVHDDRRHFEFPRARSGAGRAQLVDRAQEDLKRRGFSFVGSTIIYAHMQAVGMVNDHLVGCFRYRETQQLE